MADGILIANLSKLADPNCGECHGRGVVYWHGKIPVSCDCTKREQKEEQDA